jgi:hypothetical protein
VKALIIIAVLLGTASLQACGGADDTAGEAGAQQPGQGGGNSARDFDNLNICELIPGSAVADALGGTLNDPAPFPTTVAGLGTQCLYTVAIDGANVDARISMSPPQYWLPDEDGRMLSGLGDEAYTTETDLGVNGTAYDIYLLVRGDAEVSVTSNTFERAELLARLALDHM